MSDAAAKPALQALETPAQSVSVWDIFLKFLIIGGTSFGGVVPYLREGLVTNTRWIDDKEFVEMLSISQSLPGLNATNMAVLVGEKLRGVTGAIAGLLGMCLPGGVLMFAMLVTVCVAGTASMFLHVNEPMGVNPIAELGPTRSEFSPEGTEKPSPS